MAYETPSEDTSSDPYRNPLERSKPLGGPAGVAIASIVPLVALALFLIFGFLGFWSWSWLFFLLIPVSGIIVYGMRGGRSR
jgi:fatty acid desaturase